MKTAAGKFAYASAGRFPECQMYENAASEKAMVSYVQRNWDSCGLKPGDEVCHKQYHYADVALQRDAYASGLVGTSDHDVVHAISACIVVLQGRESPAPFHINSKREGLRLLTHFVGDIHQPLHVVAIYLDPIGNPVDPDHEVFDPSTTTVGGNSLLDGSHRLHAEWDGIPVDAMTSHITAAVLDDARAVSTNKGTLDTWSAAWASDTIVIGKSAFQGVTFSAEDSQHRWHVTLPDGYSQARDDVQLKQIVKAGAHLAQLLQQLFP
jgi:hypothetical protein